jgi:flagellar motor switch protein FliN
MERSRVSVDLPTIVDPTLADDGHPLADLPRLGSRQASFERFVRRMDRVDIDELFIPDLPLEIGACETHWRASGLARAGVVAQFAWPRLDTRLALGVETPVAHAIADGLLGFSRLPAEGHRQVTPVEWGILSFVFARALDRLDARPGPFGAWDLTIDRVGPDPFDPRDLGPVVTWRWPARLGGLAGSIRLWAPESILARLDDTPPRHIEAGPSHSGLAATWRAEAGMITLARGLSRLKSGAVLPIDGMRLKGTTASPDGPIALACRDRDGRSWFEAGAVPNGSGARLKLASSLHREPTPREPLAVNPSPSTAAPPDVPVTIAVELGRVNLTLSRLADLKPGDVVELGRHSREPVELTSNGKLVARGELVQIDTELGVRVTNVLL